MGNRIWVIEAPGKKEAFLGALKEIGCGKDRVLATYGRLFDLPRAALGFDPAMMTNPEVSSEIHWEPKNLARAKEFIRLLAQGDEIVIATDCDLEGELIASQVEDMCAYAQRQRKSPQSLVRARILSITPQSLKQGLESSTTIDGNAVRAAKAKRILDRLLGYTLHDDADPWRLSIGRVVSPVVSSLFEDPGEAVIIRKKLEDGWNAVIRLNTVQAVHADSLVGMLHGLPVPTISAVETSEMLYEHKPLTGPEALKLCMRGLPYPPGEIQASIQRNYEKGKLSYPRTDSRTLDEIGLKWIDRMAGRESIPFEKEIAQARQSERLDRSYDAHRALTPVTEDIPSSSIPSSFLSPDEAVLRAIAQHCSHIGAPAERFTRDIGRLIDNDPASQRWVSTLRAWERNLTFVRDVDDSGFVQDPMRHELTREPDATQLSVAKWIHSPTQVVMERMMDVGLGRPSTLYELAEKTYGSYLDRFGSVNGRGKIMIEKVMRRLPELISPGAAQAIESVVSDLTTEVSIGLRLAKAWEILKKNPILLSDSGSAAPKQAASPIEKVSETPVNTGPAGQPNNTYGMY